MNTIFYVGEQPSTPLVITVRNPNGEGRDLSDYTTVTLEGTGLPAGDTDVSDAENGKVQYTLTAPFAAAGVLELRVKMVGVGGDVDYSDTFELTVNDPADAATTLLTAAQVEAMVGTSVSRIDVVRAQAVISLVSARDFTDVDWLATVSSRDLFWLKMAIAYQAAELRSRENAGTVEVPYVANATSVKNGDVAITFTSPGSEDLSAISPLARVALTRLSWMQGQRTLHAAPFLGHCRVQPDPWVLLYKLGRV